MSHVSRPAPRKDGAGWGERMLTAAMPLSSMPVAAVVTCVGDTLERMWRAAKI